MWSPLPRFLCGYRGIPAVPITVQTSSSESLQTVRRHDERRSVDDISVPSRRPEFNRQLDTEARYRWDSVLFKMYFSAMYLHDVVWRSLSPTAASYTYGNVSNFLRTAISGEFPFPGGFLHLHLHLHLPQEGWASTTTSSAKNWLSIYHHVGLFPLNRSQAYIFTVNVSCIQMLPLSIIGNYDKWKV